MSKYSELSKKLKKLGMRKISTAKGSHERWSYPNHPDGAYVIVPRHGSREISIGVERNVLKWAEENKPK